VSWKPGDPVDDGAVDAALNREELSVVDMVLVLEAPLPLQMVSLGNVDAWKAELI
jgi:hypothetical protein